MTSLTETDRSVCATCNFNVLLYPEDGGRSCLRNITCHAGRRCEYRSARELWRSIAERYDSHLRSARTCWKLAPHLLPAPCSLLHAPCSMLPVASSLSDLMSCKRRGTKHRAVNGVVIHRDSSCSTRPASLRDVQCDVTTSQGLLLVSYSLTDCISNGNFAEETEENSRHVIVVVT